MSSTATVTGAVPVERLGRVLMHEHVLSLAPGDWLSGGAADDRTGLAAWALRDVREAGIDTIVDLTTRAAPRRRLASLCRVADDSGVQIVAGMGFYKSGHFPAWMADAPVGELTEWYERAAAGGLDTTGISAGCYGEIGTSLGHVTAAEERNLRAAARAHRRSRVPISTHCTLGTMGREQVAILDEEGADLSRVVIGHQDLAISRDAVMSVLETGANAGFDTLGKEWFDYVVPSEPDDGAGAGPVGSSPAPALAHQHTWTCRRPDADRLDLLVDCIERGYTDQLVVSTDLLGRELHANAESHGSHGYHYMSAVVLPELRRRGVDEATTDTILVTNPARILGISSGQAG